MIYCVLRVLTGHWHPSYLIDSTLKIQNPEKELTYVNELQNRYFCVTSYRISGSLYSGILEYR